jgi:gamma-glutamylcyclotransferase (GGCT)/AIG2-like uncharacterized protein YtfP
VLYFAYGSNLHKDQMSRRCPAAEPLGPLILRDTRLVFRGVADVIHAPGFECRGGIWRITPACEAALDRYEGYRPDGGGMYAKEYVEIAGLPDGETEIMLYTMNSTGIYPPSDYYYAVLQEGYRDFGLKQAGLKAALEHSYADKRPSHIERKRTRRMGRPALAPRPAIKQSKPAAKPRKPHGMVQEPPKAKLTYHDPWAADVPAEQRRRKVMNLTDWLRDRASGGDRY